MPKARQGKKKAGNKPADYRKASFASQRGEAADQNNTGQPLPRLAFVHTSSSLSTGPVQASSVQNSQSSPWGAWSFHICFFFSRTSHGTGHRPPNSKRSHLSLSVLIPSSYYQHCPFPLQLEHSVCITSHRSTLLAFAASRRPSACTESPVRFTSSRLSSPLTLESSELTARCSRMPVSTVSSSMSWTETSFPT